MNFVRKVIAKGRGIALWSRVGRDTESMYRVSSRLRLRFPARSGLAVAVASLLLAGCGGGILPIGPDRSAPDLSAYERTPPTAPAALSAPVEPGAPENLAGGDAGTRSGFDARFASAPPPPPAAPPAMAPAPGNPPVTNMAAAQPAPAEPEKRSRLNWLRVPTLNLPSINLWPSTRRDRGLSAEEQAAIANDLRQGAASGPAGADVANADRRAAELQRAGRTHSETMLENIRERCRLTEATVELPNDC